MSAKSTHSGFCALCGHRATKTTMMVHVEACVAAHDKIGQPQPLVVLRFAAVGDPRYWLVIEAKADAQLRHVDALLRQLWLECCGHRSAFRVGRRELAMTTATAIAFAHPASKVDYEYDFGSTTALTGELVGKRHGSIGRAPFGCSRAMNRSCGHVAIAKPPRQWCVHTASIPTTGSSAMHMPMCTNTPARKSTFQWSIHREWAFAATPAERPRGMRV
jgi:hypothetical protein